MRRLAGAIAASLVLSACGGDPSPSPRTPCPTTAPTAVWAQSQLTDAARAVVDTSHGSFTIELLGDVAPLATANFVALARCGFYDGITFHRILAGFVIQAGDPQTRDNRGDFAGLGTGGPDYRFEVEVPPDDIRYDRHVVAMANTGQPNSNGSQFFITLEDIDEGLRRSGTYTIFGRVTEGAEAIDTIAAVPVNDPRIGVPLEPVIIEAISIEGENGEAE